MIKGMDLGLEQGRQSRAVLEAELDWLDGIFADGRPYLFGSQWTRADLTAAALLGPLVAPKEHPMVHAVVFPKGVSETMQAWAQDVCGASAMIKIASGLGKVGAPRERTHA
jgi:glutathione S-transferase